MKNNVITIFIDSVSWNSVENNRSSVNPMPFISSLKSESVTASKLYSHGPYTDAAIRSLFTGRNCLDDFGYFFRLNTSPINDFKLFHEAGYETVGFYYPFIMYGNNIKKYIDHSIYTSGFVFASEWGGSFKYYSEKIQREPLNELDCKLLKRRLDLCFEVFRTYLEDIRDNGESLSLHKKCLQDFDIERALSTLLLEQEKFINDPDKYIKNFLEEGEKHILWTVDNTSIFKSIDSSFLDDIVKENIRFFRHIKLNNFRANWFTSFPSLRDIITDIKEVVKGKSIHGFVAFKRYINLLREFDVMQSRWHRPDWQVAHTCHSIFSSGIDVIKRNGLGKNKPFYLSLNTEDPHSAIAMFAYDIQDKKEVNDEIKILYDYSKKLGTKFKGSLLYLLSLRYVDYEVEKFCNQLKELGLWENTTIMILSDHGSSYTGYPLRRQIVNCFDDECYHVPVMLRHPGFNGIKVDGYINSKDILPTVCEMVGIPQSPYFKGNSIISSRPTVPYVMTEYMGPGCPDITSRRMWLSIRDTDYVVAYKVGVYEDFENGDLVEVYNLKQDPLGQRNLAMTISRDEISYLLSPLRSRYEEIKNEVSEYLEAEFSCKDSNKV